MTDSTRSAVPRRFDLKPILAFLIHPRQELKRLTEEAKPAWSMPMLVLSIALALRVLVGGYLQARASAMGQVALPADWQWWTPDMQNNYMQAMQVTQGPVFVYVIPAVTGLIKLWLGWLIVGGLLHLVSTFLGGRGTMASALNIAAWASLPFAVRDLLRVVYMLIAGHTIYSPGLSGFAASAFVSQLLANVDLFLIWEAVLLVMGFTLGVNLPQGKAIAGVAAVLVVILLAQAGLGALSSRLGGMMITRPFI
jgi:hypothetical protein